MTIKIIARSSPQASTIYQQAADTMPLLHFPEPQTVYQQRAKRFAALAKAHPFSDYLLLAERIAQIQHNIYRQSVIAIDIDTLITKQLNNHHAPLAPTPALIKGEWVTILSQLLEQLQNTSTEDVNCVIKKLQTMNKQQYYALADLLLTKQFERVASDIALFIWSALSLYWTILAAELAPLCVAKEENGEDRQFCPICNSMPVSSVMQAGAHAGIRYLHCSLCETEWYLIRVKCSNCNSLQGISYYSLDDVQSFVKAEACSSCHSYLKIVYRNKTADVDPIADDLASLVLDAKMEEQELTRSSLNPYLFPGHIKQ